MGQYFSAVEGDPLSGSSDSYVMSSGANAVFIDEGNRTMAFVGGSAYCGKCKSIGTIIGGSGCSDSARLYDEMTGRRQAVAGDFVQCQCTTRPTILARYGRYWIIEDIPRTYGYAQTSEASWLSGNDASGFDEMIVLCDEDGNPVPNQRFRITTADGSAQDGTTNDAGETVRVRTNAPMSIEIELLI
ncbi:hypothetical protein [Caballeronia novacaledonica]|jgi:hypothetical protein|uniref:PAAR domain-containing protein n=1 Tax=Caballeronia novacaledonica TaxID=1544861 RepID=A0AA37IDU6_9BURK|nr:hypothetical protein [Caballeronia novacaledonica]GJH27409.1 hypothetical protein CBA19CS42_22855 [Caballeronia novacaledonica]